MASFGQRRRRPPPLSKFVLEARNLHNYRVLITLYITNYNNLIATERDRERERDEQRKQDV